MGCSWLQENTNCACEDVIADSLSLLLPLWTVWQEWTVSLQSFVTVCGQRVISVCLWNIFSSAKNVHLLHFCKVYVVEECWEGGRCAQSSSYTAWQMSKKNWVTSSEDYVQNSQNNPHFLNAFLLKVSLWIFSMILEWNVRAWNGEKIIAKTQKWVACKSQGWQHCWSVSLINIVWYPENLCLRDKHGTLNSDCMCLACYWSTFYKAVSSVCTAMIMFILALM